MVKCGSCRAVNADSYIRITNGHNLFDILVNLNPRFVYSEKNSYFCGSCVTLATRKLADVASLISEQNANSLSFANNKSYSSTTSDSSKDEFDVMVSKRIVFSEKGTPLIPHPIPSRVGSERKRAADKENKPCPKRFKKQSTMRQDDNIIPTMPNVSKEVTPTTLSQSNSESQSETDVLLNFERNDYNIDNSDSSEVVVGNRNSAQHKQPSNVVAEISDSSEKSVSSHVSVQQTKPSIAVAEISESPKRSADGHGSVQQEQPNNAETEKSAGRRVLIQQEPSNSVAGSSDNSDAVVGSRVSVQQERHSNTKSSNSSNTAAVSHRVSVQKGVQKTKSNVVLRGQQLRYNSDSSTEERQYPWASTEHLAEVAIETIASNSEISESDLPLATLVAPSAPAVKNPRIRESNSNVPGDIRRYFVENGQAVNVNNYSRLLAG